MKQIKLTQGKIAIVDDIDFERVNKYKWYAIKSAYNWYAARMVNNNGHRKHLRMHRFIMDCPFDKEVHHLDGDSLDNRRNKLQICSHSENLSYRKRKNGAK